MSKMRRNRDVPHIGRVTADQACALGPFPDQPMEGRAHVGDGLESVRDNAGIMTFPVAGPIVKMTKPTYPGTDIFQKLKLVTGGPKGRTDPDEI